MVRFGDVMVGMFLRVSRGGKRVGGGLGIEGRVVLCRGLESYVL